MRFLSLIRVQGDNSQQPSEQLMADMGRLMAEMSAAGVLLDTAGLRPPAESARVRLSRGKVKVTDGPFAEAKEIVGGYVMLQAASLAEAVEWTRRFLLIHGEAWEIECEVRPLDEASAQS